MNVLRILLCAVMIIAASVGCTQVKFKHYDSDYSDSQYETDLKECQQEAEEVIAIDPDAWAIDFVDTGAKKEDLLIRCMDRKGYTMSYESSPW